MRSTIMAFGEVLWDLLPSGPVLGGAAFNFAYRARELGNASFIVSRLGQDDWGRRAWEDIVRFGMDTRCLEWDPDHPTGIVDVTLDESNTADYLIRADAAYDYIEMGEACTQIAASARCLCFGTLAQRSPISRRALHELLDLMPQAVRLHDINLRKNCFSLPVIRESLEAAHILKLNREEALHLATWLEIPHTALPELTKALIEKYSLLYCLITMDSLGVFASANSGEQVYLPGYQVQVVDTVGAGDAFTAGFAHQLLEGASLAEACEYANALGAIVATLPGGTSPVSPETIQEFLMSPPARNIDHSLERLQYP